MFATISVLLAIWFYTIMVSMSHIRGNTNPPPVPVMPSVGPNKKVSYKTAIEKTIEFFQSFADSSHGDITHLLEEHRTFANNHDPSQETLVKLKEIIDALNNLKQPFDPIFKEKLATMIEKLNGLYAKLEEFLKKHKRTAK